MPVTSLLAHLMAVTSELKPNETECLQNLEEPGDAEERLPVRNEGTAVTMLVKRTKLTELDFHGQQLLHLEWIGTETSGVASILRASCKIIIIPTHVWLMHLDKLLSWKIWHLFQKVTQLIHEHKVDDDDSL